MALRHGRNVAIYVNGADISGDLNAVNPTSEQDLVDVSVFGNLGHTLYPGLGKDSGTIEALYNSTERTVFEGLLQKSPGYSMMLPFGQLLGDPVYAVNEISLKANSIKSVVTDVNRVSFSFETQNFPFESGVMLSTGLQSVAAASSGQGAAVDNSSASGTTGGAAYLQVFAVSAGTLTVTVQTSSTGAWLGEQATTATFAAASTSGTQRVAVGSQIERYARAVWVASLGTGSFALALKRY